MVYIFNSFLLSSPERYKMLNDNNFIAICKEYIKRERETEDGEDLPTTMKREKNLGTIEILLISENMTMSTEFETDQGRTDENRTEQDRTEMSKLLEEIAKGAKDTRNRKLIINVKFKCIIVLFPRKRCFLCIIQ